MRRLFVLLALVLLLISPYAASQVSAQCGTPVPTWTPTPTYQSIVLGTQSANLIAYFPLNETSGTVATDLSGVNADGAYSGVTLNATTFLNGDPAPGFDGINDFVNIYSSALNANFSGLEGSAMLWLQVDSGTWTNGTQSYAMRVATSGATGTEVRKLATNNRLYVAYNAGGESDSTQFTRSDTDWLQVIWTWSDSADAEITYLNGASEGTQTPIGTWSGTLDSTRTVLGAATTSAASPWYGNIAHVALWNTVLNSSEVAALYNVPSPASPTPTVQPTCTSTPTPTPTDTPVLTWTPTPSITPTADLIHYLTVIPPGGTEDDAQIAALRYEATAGEIMVTIPLFILAVLAIMRQVLRMRGR